MPRQTRQEKKEITLEKLRQAALLSFAKNGVRGSSIENITLAAGFSRGAFYANYDSKLELLIDVLKQKQIRETRLWRKALEDAEDIEQSLINLTERYQHLPQAKTRRLLSMELQLEASRNEEFRPAYKAYLDILYDEVRRFLLVLFERNGKSIPEDIDSIVVANRILGLGLVTEGILGNKLENRTSPSQIMLDYLHSVLKAAPDIKQQEIFTANGEFNNNKLTLKK